MTDQTFAGFGFAEPLTRALTQCGYAIPTPIQQQAMPPQLEGRDLLGLAETGSGKTATFVLPLLQKIAVTGMEPGWKQPLTLILAPTRELAVQIDAEVASLARNMNIRRAVILGGVSKGPQINALKRGVHVLVATPGRLLDHVNMRTCDLSGVTTLVLDEADRMFDMGFIRDIRKIVSLIPAKRRTALFSATMPPEIRKFAHEVLQDPFRIDLSPKSMVVDRIDQKVMIVRAGEKQSRLHTLLASPDFSRVIVFTKTKRGADRVADRLGMAGINACAFHGNKAQNARQRALNDFMNGHTRVLVATDIAARGIDVSNISHVVNFDMPLDPETYVHRVGRTARKGLSGIAISLCDPSERAEIKAIEKLMKQPIEVIDDVGGEVLAMPERRPHHAHDAPRHQGAHRKGPKPDRAHGGGNGPRGEHRNVRRDASDGDRAAAPARADQGTFNARPERKPRDDRHGDRQSERPREHKSEPKSNWRPENAERSAKPNRDDGGPAGNWRGEGRSDKPNRGPSRGPKRGPDRAPDRGPSHGPRQAAPGANAGAPARPDRNREERRPNSSRPPVADGGKPHAHHADKKPKRPSHGAGQGHGHERGATDANKAGGNRGQTNWDGQKPPKFLKQRATGGRPAPNRPRAD